MFEVRASCIHGLGLFATESISRGTIIVEAVAITMMQRGALDDTPLARFVWQNEGLDCISMGPISFCNHSKRPNCVSVLHRDTDLLISIKSIGRGDELTLDYNDFSDEQEDFMKC